MPQGQACRHCRRRFCRRGGSRESDRPGAGDAARRLRASHDGLASMQALLHGPGSGVAAWQPVCGMQGPAHGRPLKRTADRADQGLAGSWTAAINAAPVRPPSYFHPTHALALQARPAPGPAPVKVPHRARPTPQTEARPLGSRCRWPISKVRGGHAGLARGGAGPVRGGALMGPLPPSAHGAPPRPADCAAIRSGHPRGGRLAA